MTIIVYPKQILNYVLLKLLCSLFTFLQNVFPMSDFWVLQTVCFSFLPVIICKNTLWWCSFVNWWLYKLSYSILISCFDFLQHFRVYFRNTLFGLSIHYFCQILIETWTIFLLSLILLNLCRALLKMKTMTFWKAKPLKMMVWLELLQILMSQVPGAQWAALAPLQTVMCHTLNDMENQKWKGWKLCAIFCSVKRL